MALARPASPPGEDGGLTTVLVAKDRVLGHNPVAALALADSYYGRLWGPERPVKPPKLPPAGRCAG